MLGAKYRIIGKTQKMCLQSPIVIRFPSKKKRNAPTYSAFQMIPQVYHLDEGIRRYGIVCDVEVFCNPETQFSQRRARAGTQSGDCGHTVVTLLSLHAQSLCCATQSGRGRTQSGFWRWFSATQSGFSVTVRELTVNLRHTVRLCCTQSVGCRRHTVRLCRHTAPSNMIKHAATSCRVDPPHTFEHRAQHASSAEGSLLSQDIFDFISELFLLLNPSSACSRRRRRTTDAQRKCPLLIAFFLTVCSCNAWGTRSMLSPHPLPPPLLSLFSSTSTTSVPAPSSFNNCSAPTLSHDA